jgi:hypothetical protein
MPVLADARRTLLVLPLLLIASRAGASDLVCYRVGTPITVDGYSADWADIDGRDLPGERGSLKFAHDQANLYVLLCISQTESAYLISHQGISLWIDAQGGQCERHGVRYSGSKELADVIERDHNPFPNLSGREGSFPEEQPPIEPPPGAVPPSLPPGMPPGGPKPPGGLGQAGRPSGQDPRKMFKKTMDPGIVFVTKSGRASMQLECMTDDFCAAARYDPPFFCYEFRLPVAELGLEPKALNKGEIRKLSVGLQIPELQQDREVIVTMAPAQGQAGGAEGMGGMGGGPPGGGMGGGPPGGGTGGGGTGGGPPGGGMGGGGMGGGPPGGGMGGGSPGGGMGGGPPGGQREFRQGPTYSVSNTVRWMDLVVSSELPQKELSRPPAENAAPGGKLATDGRPGPGDDGPRTRQGF